MKQIDYEQRRRKRLIGLQLNNMIISTSNIKQLLEIYSWPPGVTAEQQQDWQTALSVIHRSAKILEAELLKVYGFYQPLIPRMKEDDD